MEILEDYLKNTDFAIRSLFDILLEYESQHMRDFVGLVSTIQTKSLEDVKEYKIQFNSRIFSKNVIAGSILQIAYMAIKLYSKNKIKNSFLSDNERYVNENKSLYKFCKDKTFEFNIKFCVGREIEGMPIGLIIYAARNQFNHMDKCIMDLGELTNKLVLDYLYKNYSQKINDFDFNVYRDDITLVSHSVLDILGWTSRTSTNPYEAYKRDIIEALC